MYLNKFDWVIYSIKSQLLMVSGILKKKMHGLFSFSEKKFEFGFGSRHCCLLNVFEKSHIKHLERDKNVGFSGGKLFSVVQIPKHI
jgi:hypothetical protein